MIKKLIGHLIEKVGTNKEMTRFGKLTKVTKKEHGIDPALVDEKAQYVVQTLQNAGYQAYIVGGAVRDLLLGLAPKDFDVATNATPEEVKDLFRRAFIIGRRFRIVHIVFGRGRESEVIEVSTFRAYLDSKDAQQVKGNEKTHKKALENTSHAVDAAGRVLRDNVWGPVHEDAARRDFSINAMYYDPQTETVLDYHGGIKDAKKKKIRMIGDAAARYREDPVRIIRAIRFAAKLSNLGFELDKKTKSPLQETLPLLASVPQSRLFDEMLKLLQTGHAGASLAKLKELGLEKGIYPLLDYITQKSEEPFIKAALRDTDARIAEGKGVSPSFLLSCALWQEVKQNWEKRLSENQYITPALHDAIDEIFEKRIGDISGRGKLASDMREIWTMQLRFEKRTGHSPFSLLNHQKFRAAYDFLRLRAEVGEIDILLADWWQEFQNVSDDQRRAMIEQIIIEKQKAHSAKQKQKAAAEKSTRASRTYTIKTKAPVEEQQEEIAKELKIKKPKKRNYKPRNKKPKGENPPQNKENE